MMEAALAQREGAEALAAAAEEARRAQEKAANDYKVMTQH